MKDVYYYYYTTKVEQQKKRDDEDTTDTRFLLFLFSCGVVDGLLVPAKKILFFQLTG